MPEPKREMVLLPGQYAFVRMEKGNLKVYRGPHRWDLGSNESLVIWNKQHHTFEEVPLDRTSSAISQEVVVPRGYYAILTNPAKKESEFHPEPGRGNDTVDLNVGEKRILNGPAIFALWPGQEATRVRGHHLSRNEYCRIKVYDPEKAKANWLKASVEAAKPSTEAAAEPAKSTDGHSTDSIPDFFSRPPGDLAMGKQYNIRGDQISYYVPPDGVTVVPEDGTSDKFVREALTLQLLQYCILEGEDGNKRYVRGPDVVFPGPTETFREDKEGNIAFRALELNAIQRIHLKFSKDIEIEILNEKGHKESRHFKAGDEVSFTGAELPIYYPSEGHQIVAYNNQAIHYAVQVAEGEGRYVLERLTGNVKTVRGPAMLLPDPTKEVIAQRPLTDQQVRDWFPGPDGNGSPEALAWNRDLRERANKAPTTRAGLVAETPGANVLDTLSQTYLSTTNTVGSPPGAAVAGAAVAGAAVSRQGKKQQIEADTSERGATFTDPRAVTLFNKFKGVPLIDLWPGFAICLNKADGRRHVVEGPCKNLLDFGDTLDNLQVSTGKPKSTDRLQHVTYLQVRQNRITDLVEVSTSDNVTMQIKLSYIVDFQNEAKDKWFTISNFVKHLCDSVRSRLKAMVRRQSVRMFYTSPTDHIRDLVLGKHGDVSVAPAVKEVRDTRETRDTRDTTRDTRDTRPGMYFPENGMKIVDVDVLNVEIQDESIRRLLDDTQRKAVSDTIAIERSHAELRLTTELETNKRFVETEMQKTVSHHSDLEIAKRQKEIEEQKATQSAQEERDKLQTQIQAAKLAREKAMQDQNLANERSIQALKLEVLEAETKALTARYEKMLPGFTEALLSLKDADLLTKVSQALSAQMLFGGENVAEVLAKVAKGTGLEAILKRIESSASKVMPMLNSGGDNGSVLR